MGCAEKTSEGKVDSQEMDYVGKPTDQITDSQDDAAHKSTQTAVPLKSKPSLTQTSTRQTSKHNGKLPTTRKDDFLWNT
jgi:hypothetical protein